MPKYESWQAFSAYHIIADDWQCTNREAKLLELASLKLGRGKICIDSQLGKGAAFGSVCH